MSSKHYFVLLVFVLGFFITNIQAQKGGVVKSTSKGTFLPNQNVYDFGTILEKKGKVSHTFIFKNTGKQPVVINDVKTGCGCTTANFTKNVILPGKEGMLTVIYDPSDRQGIFSKLIEAHLNDGKDFVCCRIKGTVIPYVHTVEEKFPYAFGCGLFMNYQTLTFSSQKIGEPNAFFLRIANNTNKKMEITFKRIPNNRVLKMEEKLILKPKEQTLIAASYALRHHYRYNRHILIYPFVNGKRVKPLRIEWLASKKD